MERLTRPCKDTENGRYIPYVVGNYTGIYSNSDIGQAVERLAYYENLEEEGRLIVLSVQDIQPCRNCDIGWESISTDGSKSCHDDCKRLKEYNEKYHG